MKTIKTNDERVVEIEVNYSLGGMNYFTGVLERRGYYLHCTPVRYMDRGKVYTAFTGVKELILEVKRKSKKAEQKAKEMAVEREQVLLDHVCEKNNLIIKENV